MWALWLYDEDPGQAVKLMKDSWGHLLTWHDSSTITVSKPLPDELTASTRGPDPHPDSVEQITCDKKTRTSLA